VDAKHTDREKGKRIKGNKHRKDREEAKPKVLRK
jgi:hypothetical protein